MTTKSKRKRLPSIQLLSIQFTDQAARELLYLVVERLCAISNDWSRKANAERKRLAAIRGTIEDAIGGGDA